MKKSLDPKLPVPVLDPNAPDPPIKPDGFLDRNQRRLNELFKEFDDGTVAIYDEGVYKGQADGLNFIGDAVTATASSTLPTGIFDITVTASAGTGTTLDTLSVTASEDVAAGDLINIFSASGVFKGRKAKASASGYEAYGWTDSAVLSGSTITVRFLGKNTHSSGLTPGPVFLSDTAGLATSTCPSGSGHVAQQVGVADSASEFAFEWQPAVLLAATHAVTTGGSTTSVEITTTQNITINNAVGAGWLTMVGGGAGGASTGNAVAAGGGGGGSAEYCQNFMIPLTPGETVTVTIGAGGTAGNAGGTTSFACAAGTFSVLGGEAPSGSTSGGGGGPKGGASTTTNNPGNPGALGTAESPVHFGGSSGGSGGNGASSDGGAGGGGPGNLTGGAGGVHNTHGGGGGGGGATPWGVGGAGGAGNAGGSNAPAGHYGAGGGGAGGNDATGQTGGTGCDGYVLLMYVA